MKTHVRFVELGDRLKVILEEDFDLTSGSGLPLTGDNVYLLVKRPNPRHFATHHRQHDQCVLSKQFRIVERHWHVSNIIGQIDILVLPTSEEAKTIT